MKHVILAILLSVVATAADKQIIIGSYLEKNNAFNELKILDIYINDDSKLQNLIKINALHVESKKIEKYYVVSVLGLPNYVQLLRTLESLQTYYPDAYVLDAPMTVIPVEIDVAEVDSIAKELQKATTAQAPVMKKNKPKVKKQIIQSIVNDSATNNKEYFEYLLVTLALLGLSFMVYKRKKQPKED